MKKETEILYEGKITDRLQKRENKLFFSTQKGKVYGVDGTQRQILWEYNLPESLTNFPFLVSDRLFVYDRKNTLFCLDQKGQLQWEKHIPDKITSPPGGNQEKIYIGTGKGRLFCLSAENGEKIWSFKAEGPIRSNPVGWNHQVIFGSDDHFIYLLSQSGNLIGKHDAGGPVGTSLCVDENYLYFATENHFVHCLNLNRKKLRWSVKLGGITHTPPVIKENKILFLSKNGVIFCLNKRNGTVLWWNQTHARSHYAFEVIEDKAVTTSLSSQLISFDINSGKEEGVFDASQEIQSNPLWFSPYLLVNLHDRENDTGKLVFLKKQVKATLSPSKKSPQTVHEEIIFTAKTSGFYRPKYEFYMTRIALINLFFDHNFLVKDSEKMVVQEASEENTWEWMPAEPGIYIIEVKAVDEKETASAEYPYMVNKEKPTVILSSSVSSPQEPGTEVVFTANIRGLKNPEFEFRLSRLENIFLEAHRLTLVWRKEELVQDFSDKSSWSLVPEEIGIYLIKVTASDPQDKAENAVIFIVKSTEF